MSAASAAGRDDWEEVEEDSLIPVQIPREYRQLAIEEQNLTVRDLWSRFLSGELMLEPDFQRHYVWDIQRASRFVESVLLGLPLPRIFLAENRQGTVDVIDGHQRLETLFRFMSPLLAGPSGEKWPHAKRLFPNALTLSGLEVLTELEGRQVTALDTPDRAILWDRLLNVVWIRKESNEEMKFVLFARLNLGSMSLNPQELRNCIYRGPYNKLIMEVAEDPGILALFGRKLPDKRMRDREKVLRFFALAHHRQNYTGGPFRSFLNEEMKVHQHAAPDELSNFRREFRSSIAWVTRVFPSQEFRMFRQGNSSDPNGYWDRRMDLIFDVEMVGFHEFDDSLTAIWSQIESDRQSKEAFVLGLKRSLIDVMTSDLFHSTLREQTLKPHVIRRRLELWFDAVRRATDDWEAVAQDAEQVLSLQRSSTACILCPQHLQSAEDAVVVSLSDRDGLAHRFCRRNQVAQPISSVA